MHAYIFRFPPVQNMPPVACLSQWVGSRASIVLAEVGGLVGCNAVLSLCVLSTWCYGLNLFKLAASNISRVYPWSWLIIKKANSRALATVIVNFHKHSNCQSLKWFAACGKAAEKKCQKNKHIDTFNIFQAFVRVSSAKGNMIIKPSARPRRLSTARALWQPFASRRDLFKGFQHHSSNCQQALATTLLTFTSNFHVPTCAWC